MRNKQFLGALFIGFISCAVIVGFFALVPDERRKSTEPKPDEALILQPSIYMQNELTKPVKLDTNKLLMVLIQNFESHYMEDYQLTGDDILLIDSVGPYLFVDIQNYRDREIHILKYDETILNSRSADHFRFIQVIPFQALGAAYQSGSDEFVISAWYGLNYFQQDIQSHHEIVSLDNRHKQNEIDKVWTLWKLGNDSLSLLQSDIAFGANGNSPVHVSQILSGIEQFKNR